MQACVWRQPAFGIAPNVAPNLRRLMCQSWRCSAAGDKSSHSLPRLFSTSACSRGTHPREWAIWRKLDTDQSGTLTVAEIRDMCRKFDTSGSAALLVSLLDPAKKGFCTFEEFCQNFNAVTTVRREARRRHWNRTFGLGVAGNVAGHMEQAGEAEAPKEGAEEPEVPAGIFTFFAPHPHTVDATEDEVLAMIEQFPVTNAVIDFPHVGGNVQVEPEMGLYVDIVYSKDGQSVERLTPRRIAAFNDCSLRELDGAEKLTEKKNWGFGSKGISVQSIRVNSIAKGSFVDQLVLTSFIKRNDTIHQYSVSAPARNYLMFHDELLDWIVEQINHQKNVGKWLPIFPDLLASDYPTSMWIAVGAGEYTEWGATNFLQPEDETVVLIYDEAKYPDGPDDLTVEHLFGDIHRDRSLDGIIALHQTFV